MAMGMTMVRERKFQRAQVENQFRIVPVAAGHVAKSRQFFGPGTKGAVAPEQPDRIGAVDPEVNNIDPACIFTWAMEWIFQFLLLLAIQGVRRSPSLAGCAA